MKTKYVATCDSDECTLTIEIMRAKKTRTGIRYDKELRHTQPLVKLVSKQTVDCPDCGCVLFWSHEDKVENNKNMSRKKTA